MVLLDYFQDRDLTKKALTNYLRFANEADWRIGTEYGKLCLYRHGSDAFDAKIDKAEALEHFRTAYETIRSWPGVTRGGNLASPDEVYNKVRLYRGDFVGSSSKTTLANLAYPSDEARRITAFLESLHFIKSNQQYPWMAVSKILHFCNPALFPIWDWEVLWNRVMHGSGTFSRDYKRFCDAHGFKVTENGAVFLLYYTLWAAEHIQNADDNFMLWFTEWMQKNFATDVQRYAMEPHLAHLYATAFEFIAIGASQR